MIVVAALAIRADLVLHRTDWLHHPRGLSLASNVPTPANALTVTGEVRFFGNDLTGADGSRLKVPHMGWNRVEQTLDHPLWGGIDPGARFYFVHSYYVDSADPSLVAGTSDYGVTITAAMARDNLFAVQFHPEKSAEPGLQLLRNFLDWNGVGAQ